MTFEALPTFRVIDYCVFAAMLVISATVGVVMSFRGNKSPEDFLMGSRAFGPVPIAMSLLTSYISAISLLGLSGEVYARGIQIAFFVAGVVLAILACNVTTLPVFHPLKLTSVNEYISLRFKSRTLRSFILFLCCARDFFFMGTCLYAPTIALSSVTPVDSKTYIYVLGAVCSIYSALGGMKAVVWTDVFQLTVMMFGITVIVILGCTEAGGLMNIWETAKDGGRLDMFNMNLSIYQRHSFPNVILFGFTMYAGLYGIAQINVQRICSVQKLKEAKLVMYLNIIGLLIIYFLIFTVGLMGYAIYEGCDPLALGKIAKPEQIMPYYVVDKLRHIWGLSGLFVATLIAGTLSSLSSVINGQVAMMWKDALVHFKVFANATPQSAAVVNKILSIMVGVLLIGMAVLASEAKNLAQFSMTLLSASNGPVLGVFLMGLFFPRCNNKGVWSGLIVSLVCVSWIVTGSFMYGQRPENLPVSAENCTNSTWQTLNSDFYDNTTESFINDKVISTSEASIQSSLEEGHYKFSLMWLYGISYTLFPFIGTMMCLVVGLLVSFVTGSQSIEEVSPDLIVPCVRTLYWKGDRELKVVTLTEPKYILVTPALKPQMADSYEAEKLLLS